MASQWPPKKNTAFTLYFTLYKNDGTVIANPGTITKKVSIDGAAVADITAAVTEEDTTYGQCSVVLSTSEMNGDGIWVYIKDDTSGCVPFTCTIYTAANLMDEIKTDTAAILADTGTDGVVLAADAITAAKIADNAFSNEHFADGALTSTEITSAGGCVVASIANDAITAASINTGAFTADAFAADAIVAATLATGALTADAFAADAFVAATFATDCITDDAIATGAIASTAFAAGAIDAAAIANGAIDNATFAADVGSTAYATNIIAIAAKKALDEYDPPTKAELDTAVANVSVDEIQATALADLFNTDSATTYAAAVAGSVVKEIADNAGGSALTAAGIADAVWDEALAGHVAAGSAGEALGAAGTAGDPWTTALPGAYGAGTAGKIIGDNINAPIATVDTVVDGIVTTLGVAGAGLTAVPWNASWDAEVQSECADALTAYDPPTNAEMEARTLVSAGYASPTNITAGTITTVSGNVNGSVGSVTGAVGSVTGNVGGSVASVTAGVTLANGAQGGAAMTITAKSIVVTNSDAGGDAVTLTGSGSGNSHALVLASTSGSALSATAGSHAIYVNSSAGNGMEIVGATGDIVADITGTLATCTTNTDMLTAAAVWGATNSTLSLTYAVIASRLYRFLMNKMNITDATGAVALRNEADGADLATQTITDNDTTTTRTALTWA